MSSSNLILGEGILLRNSSNGSTTLTLISDIVNPSNENNSNVFTGHTGIFQYSNIVISPGILTPQDSDKSVDLTGPTGAIESPPFISGITLINPNNASTQISIATDLDIDKSLDTDLSKAPGSDKAFSFLSPNINIVNSKDGKTNIELIEPDQNKLPSFSETKFVPNGSGGSCGPCNPCPPVAPTPFGSVVFSTIQLGNPSQGTQVTLSTDGTNLYLQPSGGNLYTGYTGTIIGSGGIGETGPTGPPGSSTYQICPPPFEFGTPYSTAANIYIPIIYPDQEYVGDFPQAVPTIESTILDLSYVNGSDTITTANILNTGDIPFDSNYQNGLSSSNRSKPYANFPLEGVILNNSIEDPKTNPVKPVPAYNTFYDSTNIPYSVWSIVYYINNPKISSVGNSMTGTYTNYSDCIVPDEVIFDGFLPPTPPSNDAYYMPLPAGYTYVSPTDIALNILPPTDTDIGDNPGVFIKRYTSTYYTTGSTIRYGGPVSQGSVGSPLTQIVPYTAGAPIGTPFNTNTNISIYPDSLYTFNLTSTNSIGGISDLCYGVTGRPTPPNYPTSFLPMLIYPTPGPASLDISDYSSPSAFFLTPFVGNAWLVSTQNQVTNLFNKTSIVTNLFGEFSINYDPSTRGLLGSAKTLMNIDTNTSTSSTINFSTNQNYQSFPLASSASSGTTLSMSSSGTSDQYSASIVPYRGFYSKVTINNITLALDSYPASTIQRIFNVIQKYYQANGSSLAATYSTAQNFYYDQVVGPPIIDSVNAVLVSSTVYVSGVNIVANNPTFSITTSTRNMGDYYYRSPLLTYTFGGSASGVVSESNLVNLTSSISGGAFVEPVTFQNNNVSGTINPNFGKDIEIQVNAFNIVQSTASFSLATVDKQGIYDYPSYNLVYLSGNVPTTIQHLLVGSTYPVALGCRVWSAPMTTPINLSPIAVGIPPPYGHTNSSTLYSYSQFIYNQEWNITKNNTAITTPFSGTIDTKDELQIFNGAYQTVASTPGTNGYFDYSNRFANTGINYTVSTGAERYRYATFVWKFENNALAPTQSSNFTFTLKNFKCRGVLPTIGRDNKGAFYISNNGNTQRLLFYYRVEEYIGSTIYVNPLPSDNTKITTIWADGNCSFATTNIGGVATLSSSATLPAAISSGNYATPSDNSIVRDVASNEFIVVGNDLQIKAGNIILNASTNSKCYVYIRIGLPMIDNYSFEYATLQITQ